MPQADKPVDAWLGTAQPLHERLDRERRAAPRENLVEIVDAVELVHGRINGRKIPFTSQIARALTGKSAGGEADARAPGDARVRQVLELRHE